MVPTIPEAGPVSSGGTYWWYGPGTYAADIFGEALLAEEHTASIDYGNTPGHCAEGRWQCRTQLRGRWFIRRLVGSQVDSEGHAFSLSPLFPFLLSF